MSRFNIAITSRSERPLGGVRTNARRPEQPGFFPGERHEPHVAAQVFSTCRTARDLEQRRGAGRVVVGAVVDLANTGGQRARAPEADVVVVRADHHRAVELRFPFAGNPADDVVSGRALADEIDLDFDASLARQKAFPRALA